MGGRLLHTAEGRLRGLCVPSLAPGGWYHCEIFCIHCQHWQPVKILVQYFHLVLSQNRCRNYATALYLHLHIAAREQAGSGVLPFFGRWFPQPGTGWLLGMTWRVASWLTFDAFLTACLKFSFQSCEATSFCCGISSPLRTHQQFGALPRRALSPGLETLGKGEQS